MSATTKFPLGFFGGDNPNGIDATAQQAFKTHYDTFVNTMGGARPQFMDAYIDQGITADQWGSNASWSAWSWAQTGDNYVGPNSGIVPVFGVKLTDSANAWGNVDTFYQQIIYGAEDANYKAIVDAWAQQGYKNVEFRISYEFNGHFMNDSPFNGNSQAPADWIKAWQHVANLIHQEGAADGIAAKTVWCPAAATWDDVSPSQMYPGDQYVDVISLDQYSAQWGGSLSDQQTYWAKMTGDGSVSSISWGMDNTIAMAKLHNKPLGLDETGAGTQPGATPGGPDDNPAFVQWQAAELASAQAQGVTIDHVNLWDDNAGDINTRFSDGARPLEAAAYKLYYGAGSGSSGSSGSGSSGSGSSGSSTSGSGSSGSGSTTPPPAVTIGTGPNKLVLQVSEDAYQGDAQFTVSVDGTQIGGTQTALASHGAGQSQTFTVLGTFGAGSHTVSVNFLNDAYGGTAGTDRNLYVASATIDGKAISGSTLTELSGGAQSFTFQGSAATAGTPTPAAGSVIFTDSAGHTFTQKVITSGSLDTYQNQSGLANNVHQWVDTAGVRNISADGWGQVTTANLTDASGASYALHSVNETDVHLSGATTTAGKSATLTLDQAQRGTIVLGSGNYAVNFTPNNPWGSAADNTVNLTMGSGNDSFVINGTYGLTNAVVHAGSGTDTMSFVGAGHTVAYAGSGKDTIVGSANGDSFVAGLGNSDVTGGGGADIFVYHAAAPGMMTVEDFSASQGDTVRIDATLKASMHQTSGSSGLMISFGTDSTHGILLKGVSSLPTSGLTWT